MTGPLVLVEWRDAGTHDEWSVEHDTEPVRCYTAGFVLRDDETAMAVAGTRGEGGQHCSLMIIPRGCIVSVTRLRRSRP